MKKIIFPAVIAILFLVSCTNNELALNESEILEPNNELKDSPPDDWGIHRVFTGEICEPPAVNCFDDIIITPGDDERKSANALDTYLTDNPADIKAFFLSDEYKSVFPNLSNKPEFLSRLRSGKYSAMKVDQGLRQYYLFGKKGEFTQKNPEFVIPVKYE
jgi:hypothetical protein